MDRHMVRPTQEKQTEDKTDRGQRDINTKYKLGRHTDHTRC